MIYCMYWQEADTIFQFWAFAEEHKRYKHSMYEQVTEVAALHNYDLPPTDKNFNRIADQIIESLSIDCQIKKKKISIYHIGDIHRIVDRCRGLSMHLEIEYIPFCVDANWQQEGF